MIAWRMASFDVGLESFTSLLVSEVTFSGLCSNLMFS